MSDDGLRDLLDEDRQLKNDLAALEPTYLRELDEVLSWSQERRDEFSRKLVGTRLRGDRDAARDDPFLARGASAI